MNTLSANSNTVAKPDQFNLIDQERVFRYGFKLGEYGFLVPEGAFSNVIENASIFTIPNTINWVRGLINLRGEMIPVFDLSAMLNLNHQVKKQTAIVIKTGNRSMAFLTDGGQSLEQSTLSETQSKSTESISKYTQTAYQLLDTRWYEFDYSKFLSAFDPEISA